MLAAHQPGSAIQPTESVAAILVPSRKDKRTLDTQGCGFSALRRLPCRAGRHNCGAPFPISVRRHLLSAVATRCDVGALTDPEQHCQRLSRICKAGKTPSLATYVAAIATCARKKDWSKALHLFEDLCDRNVESDTSTFNAAMNACERGQRWGHAFSFIEHMHQRILVPDSVSFRVGMRACAQGEQWRQSLRLFAALQHRDLEPNAITCGAAITACEKGEQWIHAVELLAMAIHDSIRVDVVVYSATISACEKAGAWSHALALLGQAQQQNLIMDRISVSAATSACGKAHQWERSLHLLGTMLQDHLEPDGVTYASILSACETSCAWASAVALFEDMKQAAVETNGIHYGTLVSALSRSDLWMFAVAVLEQARTHWESQDACERRAEDANMLFGPACHDHNTSWEHAFSVVKLGVRVVAFAKPPWVSSEVFLSRVEDSCKTNFGAKLLLSSVSRLDLLTSGVLVAAIGGAGSSATQWLQAQFAGRIVSKTYLCLCVGKPIGLLGTCGEIASPLRVDRIGADTYRASVSSMGRRSRTTFQVLANFEPTSFSVGSPVSALTLVKVHPMTGRTHQIRAHFASIGLPLVADLAYGGSNVSWCPRPFLHCQRVLLWDLAGEPFSASAALAPDLIGALNSGCVPLC